jgi:integrase
MFRRTRYQQGSLQRIRRKRGPDCWVFRWYALNGAGRRQYRKAVVGTVEQYPTESSAQTAVAALRLTINQETPRSKWQPILIRDLINHYKETDLTLDVREGDPDEHEKAYSTKKTYRIFLDRWITPRWGSHSLRDVRTIAVEEWLRRLTLPNGKRMANGTKAKTRNIMHALFNHAIRYEWLPQNLNPISHVRQSAKRERIPDVLDVAEFQALLSQLALRERTLVVLDAVTGLRRSELLGLKWSDVDFKQLEIRVVRAIVHQVVGRCKTEASTRPLPLDPTVAEELWLWNRSTPYNQPDDWVFASNRMDGKQPLSPDSLLSRQIHPAAKRVGITKRVGWHTFRHTYSTLLKANGEDIKVVQELLRHANSRITLDIYTQALTPAKREAQTRVANLILPKKTMVGESLTNPFKPSLSEAGSAN